MTRPSRQVPDYLMTDWAEPPNDRWFDERERRVQAAAGMGPATGSSLGPDTSGPELDWGGFETMSTDDAQGDFPEPEDRGLATRSLLGETEYVADLIRPGRSHVVAAEEDTGKTFAMTELAVRLAVAGGSFAGTWPVTGSGSVLVCSEMHADDDLDYEQRVLDSLGVERHELQGHYFRLDLHTAAHGRPPLIDPDWRAWLMRWVDEHDCKVVIFDTATGATQIDPWGPHLQQVYRDLRVILTRMPSLAIILVLHLKKPRAQAGRRITDVLGEWGRWCDVLLLMERDGERTRLSTRKRVRHQRRITATRAGGLLVDPVDIADTKPLKKRSLSTVMATITAKPGITYLELAKALKVSKDTAARYVRDLGDSVRLERDPGARGPAAAVRVFPVAASPHDAAGADAASGAVTDAEASPHAARTYKGAAGGAAVTEASSDDPFEVAGLAVEDDYPASAWEVDE